MLIAEKKVKIICWLIMILQVLWVLGGGSGSCGPKYLVDQVECLMSLDNGLGSADDDKLFIVWDLQKSQLFC